MNHQSAIDHILANAKLLLEKHYTSAAALPDDHGNVKVSLLTTVGTNKFGALVASTKIAFGRRVTAITESEIEDENQSILQFKKKSANGN
jgi:hypothetical protein